MLIHLGGTRLPGMLLTMEDRQGTELIWPALERPMSADENTYVRDQNARVDPLFTIGALTVAGVREILADLPDDAVVVVARPDREGAACSPLADAQECWYFPGSGEYAPIGRDADGNVHEPGPHDLYAVLLLPAG